MDLIGTDGSQSGRLCKIHVANNFVWAAVGLVGETEGPFDLQKIVPKALKTGTPFLRAIKNLQAQLGTSFPEFLKRARTMGIAPNAVKVEIAVAGGEQGILRVSRISISQANPVPVREDCPGPACPEIGVFELGFHGAIDRILDTRHAIWREMGIHEAMRYLIASQSAATPNSVSGPVAIVELRQSGLRWIDAGTCKQ